MNLKYLRVVTPMLHPQKLHKGCLCHLTPSETPWGWPMPPHILRNSIRVAAATSYPQKLHKGGICHLTSSETPWGWSLQHHAITNSLRVATATPHPKKLPEGGHCHLTPSETPWGWLLPSHSLRHSHLTPSDTPISHPQTSPPHTLRNSQRMVAATAHPQKVPVLIDGSTVLDGQLFSE